MLVEARSVFQRIVFHLATTVSEKSQKHFGMTIGQRIFDKYVFRPRDFKLSMR